MAPPGGVPTAKQRANLEDQKISQPDRQEYASQVPNDGAELRSPPALSLAYSKGGTTAKQVMTKPVALSGSDKANHKDNENHMSKPPNDAAQQGGSRTSPKGAPTETAAIETTSETQMSHPGDRGDDDSQVPNDGAKLRDPTSATANSRGTATGKPVVAGHAVVSHNPNQGDKRNTPKASEVDSEQKAPTASSLSSPKGAATSQTLVENRKSSQRESPSQAPINGAGQGGSTASSSSPHPNGAGSGKEITPKFEGVSKSYESDQRHQQQYTPGAGNGSVNQSVLAVPASKPGPPGPIDRIDISRSSHRLRSEILNPMFQRQGPYLVRQARRVTRRHQKCLQSTLEPKNPLRESMKRRIRTTCVACVHGLRGLRVLDG